MIIKKCFITNDFIQNLEVGGWELFVTASDVDLDANKKL